MQECDWGSNVDDTKVLRSFHFFVTRGAMFFLYSGVPVFVFI
jgi:hypothetical protein